MKSRVYFADLRTTHTHNLISKIRILLESVQLTDKIKNKALTAIKLHFGEAGNTAYIRPVFIRQIVDAVREAGSNPFLTDANTLYCLLYTSDAADE